MSPIELKGKHITLLPLGEEHRSELFTVAEDERIWTYNPMGNGRDVAFDKWFEKSMCAQKTEANKIYVIQSNIDNAIIGTTRYYDIFPKHKRLQIGYTWFSPSFWGTGVNDESKFLLLKHAFDDLGFNRVSFSVDSRNKPSCRAIQRIGAVYEGIHRSHIVLSDDYVRDTVVYSIIREDWPLVKAHLSQYC